jgi:hypothetical protein
VISSNKIDVQPPDLDSRPLVSKVEDGTLSSALVLVTRKKGVPLYLMAAGQIGGRGVKKLLPGVFSRWTFFVVQDGRNETAPLPVRRCRFISTDNCMSKSPSRPMFRKLRSPLCTNSLGTSAFPQVVSHHAVRCSFGMGCQVEVAPVSISSFFLWSLVQKVWTGV